MTAPIDWVDNDGSVPPLPKSVVNATKLNALGATINGKQAALSLTTTGTSGAATLVANVLNVPQYTAGGGGGDPSAATHAAASKATPVDADEVPLVDSAATFGLKRLTWANLKAAIKAYYDSVSSTLTNKTISGATNTLSNIPNASVTGLGPLATLTPTGTPSATTYLSGTGAYSTPAGGGGGYTPGGTDVAVADGGTGASTAPAARTNLGATTVGDAVFIAADAAAARTTLGAAKQYTVVSVASSATPTPDVATNDESHWTALAVNAVFGAPTGTPTDGQNHTIRVKDNGTARTLGYNAIYRAMGITLPTTTVAGKNLYLALKYNSTDTRWDVLDLRQEA